MRELFSGDCLDVMRAYIPEECVDLVYLDPPFNSNRDYNIFYPHEINKPTTEKVTAFGDTWIWGGQAEREYLAITCGSNKPLAETIIALRKILGETPMMAYLVMMGCRLSEVYRIMKPTGSLYLHCDVSASHYLKVVLDALFGHRNFRNEIIWHYYNKYSAGKRSFGKNFDQILFYTKSDRFTFTPQREAREKPVRQLLRENVKGVLKNKKGPDGKVMYREVSDKKVDAVWRIPCLQPASKEMIGYPTQKPLSLLERILMTSSKEGDLVLDPFCGCGTALHAAQKTGRNWVGIDVAPAAVSMVKQRLMASFPGFEMTQGQAIPGRKRTAKKAKSHKQIELCLFVEEAPNPSSVEEPQLTLNLQNPASNMSEKNKSIETIPLKRGA